MQQRIGELTIRLASRNDRLAICTLLQQAWHSAGGARWDQLDAIEAGCEAVLACRDGQTVGFSLFDLQTLPVARLSAVAIADREEARRCWDELWPVAEEYLRGRGIQHTYYAGEAPWLLEILAGHGFQQVNTLLSYEKVQGGPALAGNPAVRLRPVRQADIEVIAELDAASFPLLWRYPVPMLEATLRSNQRLTVAEYDRRLVGYEVSGVEGSTGQVVRLAVLPEYRRQAIGSRLLAGTLNTFRRGRIRRVALNTQADNLPAQALYERFGFRRTGEELPVLERAL
jgi:ribosomal-protein-alanine N-acetyltransferase